MTDTIVNPADRDGRLFPLLRRTELPSFLQDAQLKELERFCTPVNKRAGTTLFRQDAPAEAMYLLADGLVELRARPPGRRVYRTVEVVGKRCTFGDEAILGEERYLAAARLLEPARLLMLSKDDFERLTVARPDVSVGILRCSGACLMQLVRRSAILTHAPAEVALKLLLEELAQDKSKGNGQTPIRITHAQLGGMLHLSRETVSRMLGQMANEGTVELSRGVIRLRRS
jgi:CRP/FNR family transcriptional regulator, cyclic AMP receptor protein